MLEISPVGKWRILNRCNEGLTGRFYQLQGADELAQRLKTENVELKQHRTRKGERGVPGNPPIQLRL